MSTTQMAFLVIGTVGSLKFVPVHYWKPYSVKRNPSKWDLLESELEDLGKGGLPIR